MDSILISKISEVREGLSSILEDYIGLNAFVQVFVPISDALMIIAFAKRTPDREVFFPRGKWATIQAIEDRINQEISKVIEESKK